MPEYLYQAIKASDPSPGALSRTATREIIRGRMKAASDNLLGDLLREEGLELISFERADRQESFGLAVLPIFPEVTTDHPAQTEIPPELCLRLLAEESPSRKDRKKLLHAWKRYRHDQDLAATIQFAGTALPADLGAYLNHLQDGRLTTALLRELMLARAREKLFRQRIFFQIGTPFLWYVVTVMILVAAGTIIVPRFKMMFDDFGTRLPIFTSLVIGFYDFLAGYSLILLFLVALAIGSCVILTRFTTFGRLYRRLMIYVPLIGRPIYHLKSATYTEVFSLTLPWSLPLPVVARLAALIAEEPLFRESTEEWIEQMEQGKAPQDAFGEKTFLPASIASLFRLKTSPHGLQDACKLLAASFVIRAIAHVKIGVFCMPQLMVLTCVLTVGFVLFAMFSPLFMLLNSLA
ncbi:hypothetical protein [Planctopirus hydrillae]|uniref:Type II secretion system protein GspF domain-containing protein n=1 Tax=Planctopirus hydrillae TaxID=1841610 RepID=A0A1C3EA24_9PLAN|nr:hypothetical protein [Planctopirus hydrillae]ODA30091.1 hypothetical protein A6X21_07100 [Planctopirus hydrillae]